MTGNVTSLDIDFQFIYLSLYYLHYLNGPTGLTWKNVVRCLECIWLGRCILTHWYVRNLGYQTYLQIVYLLKHGVYHLWASRLVVRLRSRLDAIGLPLWRYQLCHWIARVLTRWQRPLAGKPMATRLDGCTSWRLGSDTQLDAWGLGWVEPGLELTKMCIWCKILSI